MISKERDNEVMVAFEKATEIAKKHDDEQMQKDEYLKLKQDEINDLGLNFNILMHNYALNTGKLSVAGKSLNLIEELLLDLIEEDDEDMEKHDELDKEYDKALTELTETMGVSDYSSYDTAMTNAEIEKYSREIRKIDERIKELNRVQKIIKKK